MLFNVNWHGTERMIQRKVMDADIGAALANIQSHDSTPKGSTRIVGLVDGRQLKIWIDGTRWPPKEPVLIKSVAWKDEDDG